MKCGFEGVHCVEIWYRAEIWYCAEICYGAEICYRTEHVSLYFTALPVSYSAMVVRLCQNSTH